MADAGTAARHSVTVRTAVGGAGIGDRALAAGRMRVADAGTAAPRRVPAAAAGVGTNALVAARIAASAQTAAPALTRLNVASTSVANPQHRRSQC